MTQRRLRCLLLFLLVPAIPAQEPPPEPLPIPAAVRARLQALLPPALQETGAAWLALEQPAQRVKELVRFGNDDVTAADFLVGVLQDDPAPLVRMQVVRRFDPRFARKVAGLPAAAAALERAITADPSTEVSLAALNAVRVWRLFTLGELLRQRHELAKEAKDAVAAAAIGEELERHDLLTTGNMVPQFMRRPPPPFEVLPKGRRIRVLAFGDFGTGKAEQTDTAAAMRAAHKATPFDFAVTLGDNFYPRGLESPRDPRWRTEFEDLYGPMGIRFWAALGNHDWAGADAPAAEYVHGLHSPTWRLPATYYTFTAGAVQFFAIDTQHLDDAQIAWLDGAIAQSRTPWKVVYGHFHIYSATRGDNQPLIERLLPVLVNRVDVYLCGHDHNLQALQPQAGVHFFVAGAGGAGSYDLKEYSRSLMKAKAYGFAVLEADARALTVRLVDKDRKQLHETKLTR